MSDINLIREKDGTMMLSADVAVRLDRALTLACERLAEACASVEYCPLEATCPHTDAMCCDITPAMWREVLVKEVGDNEG